MKTTKLSFVAVLFALIGSFTASAAPEQSDVIARVQGVRGFQSVSLTQDGLIEVVKNNHVSTLRLADEAFARLRADFVTVVAQAEIKKVVQPVICMMMPLESPVLEVAGYQMDTDRFDGELHVALTPMGCYVHEKHFPKEAYAMTAAESLRDQLILLALQTLN